MKLNDSCYVIYGLTAVPPWMVNAGFVVGHSRTLIIDSGANYLSAQTIHGYALAARPDNGLLAINTEPHSDHMGGNCFLREQGIDIYGHEGIDRSDDQMQAVKDHYNASVPDPFRRSHREGDLVFLKTRFVNPNIRFREDFTLDLGDLVVQVLTTPGHTPENASIYVPSAGTLFCGDTIVNGYVPNLAEGSVDDWRLWLKSLEKLEQMALDIVVPGHGEVVRGADVPKAIDRMKAFITQAITSGSAPTEAD